ncbi:MAG: hypothetical protein WCJ66_18405, partial [Verrucomicrobiota bacterium]
MKTTACPALVVNIDCASPKLTRSDSTYKSGNSVQTSGATSRFEPQQSKYKPMILRRNIKNEVFLSVKIVRVFVFSVGISLGFSYFVYALGYVIVQFLSADR